MKVVKMPWWTNFISSCVCVYVCVIVGRNNKEKCSQVLVVVLVWECLFIS